MKHSTPVAVRAISFILPLLIFQAVAVAQQFHLGATYTVGLEPQRVVVADFNNDGKLDLATADCTSQDVSILLGKGDGTFSPAQQFPTGGCTAALVVGDFNRDGNQDIAIVEYGFGVPGQLAIFLGKGDGSFVAGATYTLNLPYDVTAADFNGDGILDLAVADNGANTVDVFTGNGDGTFAGPVSYKAPLPERVLGVDLNGDKHPDLAILAYCGPNPKMCPHGAVEVLLNNGSGKFGKPHYFATAVGPDGIAAADLNQDGKIDLVVANNNFESASVISVLLGRRNGTFKKAVSYNAGAGPAGVAIADLNGDGLLDIAVANVGDSTLSLFFGKGKGKFGTAQSFAFSSGTVPISVAPAQLRSGHGLDLAVALDYAGEVAILLNKK